MAAALIGYLIGRPGEEKPPATRPARRATLTSSTTAGALGLRFPSGWDRRGEAPKIPGLVLADQVAIGPTGNEDRGIVAGMAADAGGPRLLGPGFLASLQEPPRAADRVRLGKVEALRYEGLEPKDFGGRALTVFAAPTSAGVATIACFAPPGGGAAFRADCERVAGTLEVEGETTFPLGADKKYAAALSGVIGALDKRRKAGRAALAAARTPAGAVEGRHRARGRRRARPRRPRQARAEPHRRPRAGRHRAGARRTPPPPTSASAAPARRRIPPRDRRRHPRRARRARPSSPRLKPLGYAAG